MILSYIFSIYVFLLLSLSEIVSNIKLQQISVDNSYDSNYKTQAQSTSEIVNINNYYEVFCWGCKIFESTQFKLVVEKLSEYLNIQTYPYGNAQTFIVNGTYEFKCQNGPKECYGNKLHACALHILQNHTQALLYNSCMMELHRPDFGSNDVAADNCGKSMNIDSKPIKACAKEEMGTKLLKYYGDESKKAKLYYVPYILVNGKESNGDDFLKDVCVAFVNPPPPCVSVVGYK